nr:hypothetical protein [Treponema sp.]
MRRFFIFLLFIAMLPLFAGKSSGNKKLGNSFYNSYENSYKDSYSSSYKSAYKNAYHNLYDPNYGKYLKFVIENDAIAEENFVKYFSDWQWSGQEQDFFSYAESRAERERKLADCYDAAIKKFGIGTALVATSWMVAFVVPGGQIFTLSMMVIAKEVTIGALSGGAIGAVTSAGIAYMQGKRGDELLCETINGAADGYLVGAVTGLVSGGAKAIKEARKAKMMKSFSGTETIFCENVYDETGKLIGKYDPKWYKTEKCVRDIERNGLENLTPAQKGNYGEMKTDLFMRDRGYERVSKTQVTNLTEKAPQGIDGVYYNPNGNPPYIIAEAKCGYQNSVGEFMGKKALSTPADGIEMSENWLFGNITGNNRLESAVGKKIADDIEEQGFETVLVHVNNKTGECSAYALESTANDVNIVGVW